MLKEKILPYFETPTVELMDPLLKNADVRLFVKREDLNHPRISGNKWWKLKHNILAAQREAKTTLLTYGGAYSNHIYATSAAAFELGLNSIGVIRGEETTPLNETLRIAKENGMRFYYVSRQEYKKKSHSDEIEKLHVLFGNFYRIPEGGSNDLAISGVAEFAEKLDKDFNYVCCPVGTGATLAGLVRGLKGQGKVIGLLVLKGGNEWNDEILKFGPGYENWQLIHDYHAGGYAKVTPELKSFMEAFTIQHDIPVEGVYSGKLFYGLFDLIRSGYFERGSRILAIHTGGIRPMQRISLDRQD